MRSSCPTTAVSLHAESVLVQYPSILVQSCSHVYKGVEAKVKKAMSRLLSWPVVRKQVLETWSRHYLVDASSIRLSVALFCDK